MWRQKQVTRHAREASKRMQNTKSKKIPKTKATRNTAPQSTAEFPFQPERLQRVSRQEFMQEHLWFDPQARRVKVTVSIRLDQDVLEYFKQRAAAPHAAAYQTQINAELRAVMEQEQQAAPPSHATFTSLVNNVDFITAVAEKMARLQAAKRKKAT